MLRHTPPHTHTHCPFLNKTRIHFFSKIKKLFHLFHAKTETLLVVYSNLHSKNQNYWDGGWKDGSVLRALVALAENQHPHSGSHHSLQLLFQEADLCRLQAHTWCTDILTGKNLIYIIKEILNSKQ